MSNLPVGSQRRSALDGVEELAEKLQRLEACLAQSQRLATLGTIAAGVAHEINNLLTPVLSYAHLASSNRDDLELQEKAFRKIIAGVESACQVSQTMLNYSRQRDQDVVCEVGEVLEAALGCLGRSPKKDGIEIRRQLRPITSVRIQPHALQQVLLNLILNAASAMRSEGGTITIRCEPADGEVTRIDVTDNGPGIPESVVESIFEPFVSTGTQEDREREGSHRSGSGLGLMVSRHLVEAVGGTITVRSTPGEGATFTIILPTATAPAARAG